MNGNIDKITIEPSDIMLLVNDAWNKSFAKVATNKKAIAERGWFPYNRKLLQHPDIATTKPVESITDSQETYLLYETCDLSPSSQISDVTLPTFDQQYVSRRSVPYQVNRDKGMGMHVLSHIVRENDIMLARQRIDKEKKAGEREMTKLHQIKKISAANIVRCGHYVIGKDIADEIMDRQIKREQAEHEKRMKQEAQYLKRHGKAKHIINSKKDRRTWTKMDYRTILMALKVKGDAKLPNDIKDLSLLYDAWKDREVGAILVEQDSQMTEEDDNEEMGGFVPTQNTMGGISF